MDPIQRMNRISGTIIILTVCLFALGLTGCAETGANNRMSLNMPNVTGPNTPTKAEEEAAWAKVAQLTPSACPMQQNPPAREEAVSVTRCVSKLVDSHVMPKAVFPDLVESSRTQAEKLAKDYADKKLSAAQYRERSVQRLQDYKLAWTSRAEARNLEAAAKLWKGDKT